MDGGFFPMNGAGALVRVDLPELDDIVASASTPAESRATRPTSSASARRTPPCTSAAPWSHSVDHTCWWTSASPGWGDALTEQRLQCLGMSRRPDVPVVLPVNSATRRRTSRTWTSVSGPGGYDNAELWIFVTISPVRLLADRPTPAG